MLKCSNPYRDGMLKCSNPYRDGMLKCSCPHNYVCPKYHGGLALIHIKSENHHKVSAAYRKSMKQIFDTMHSWMVVIQRWSPSVSNVQSIMAVLNL